MNRTTSFRALNLPVMLLLLSAVIPQHVRGADEFDAALCESDDAFSTRMKTTVGSFAIEAEDLGKISSYPLEKLAKCGRIVIQFIAGPGLTGRQKDEFVDQVDRALEHARALRRCPALRFVVLNVGYGTFIRELEDPPDSSRINLTRAKARFEKKIRSMLPGIEVRLCSTNW